MKVALIGNMNNNNFSIMRYFRDLGVDAHLLLWSDDGLLSSSHFGPESDTWDMARWCPFIHRTRISNSVVPVLDFPLDLMTFLPFVALRIRTPEFKRIVPVSQRYISSLLVAYDVVIGSGNTPAICHKAGRSLDIFAPYSTGIEYVNNMSIRAGLNHRNPFVRFVMRKTVERQVLGLKSTRHIVNAEVGPTADALRAYNLNFSPLAMPMVYDGEVLPVDAPSERLKKAAEVIARSGFSIFHHARLMWCTGKIAKNDKSASKNNDWLLFALAKLIKVKPELNVVLIIVEYGPDVEETKSLAQQLGIHDKVLWLPKLQRREIMWLLSKVSVGVGEFYEVQNMLWGGTGWEALACGKPLLQGFNFEPGAFECFYGHPPPPMLPVRKQEDILTHLLNMADDIEMREKIGSGAKQWFGQYNGIGLAKRWLELLQVPFDHTQEKPLLTQVVNN